MNMTELPRLPSKPRLTVFNVDESEMNVSLGQRNEILSQAATYMSAHDTYTHQWSSTLERCEKKPYYYNKNADVCCFFDYVERYFLIFNILIKETFATKSTIWFDSLILNDKLINIVSQKVKSRIVLTNKIAKKY
ncbi:unnamed protein product [Wuchereria bancrofti]|uniref:Uncharacterized protein n=1 Tax=Wuchereria bancrofti TaxID=6293 RepID=A0A3P7DRV4_WUCBA|nr:unnamed protein product [Wuchereria bancrofti]